MLGTNKIFALPATWLSMPLIFAAWLEIELSNANGPNTSAFKFSFLENLLLKTMFDLPGQENVEEVIIDGGATKGISQPIIVHTKNKSKTEKTSAA